MLKKFAFSIACSVLLSTVAIAQNAWFVRNDGKIVNTRDSADFIRIISKPDSGDVLYNVVEVYPNNKIKLAGKSITPNFYTLHGKIVTYYPNGRVESITDYVRGSIWGDRYEYFPNGKLYLLRNYYKATSLEAHNTDEAMNKYEVITCNYLNGDILTKEKNGYYKVYNDNFRSVIQEGYIKNGKRNGGWKGIDTLLKVSFNEIYESGVVISGLSVDSSGIKHHYNSLEPTLPTYKGGLEVFKTYVEKNLVYPMQSRANNIQGRVFISFIIGPDGTIVSSKILRSLDQYTSAEAERVIMSSTGWIPALKRGVYCKAASVATLPIQFGLTDPNKKPGK